MARQIQRELNKDEFLAKDIQDFRRDRGNFSHALKEAAGFGLDDLTLHLNLLEDPETLSVAVRIVNIEIESLRESEKEAIAALGHSLPLSTSEDVLNLQHISLFKGEDELRNAIVGLTQAAEVDYARENPGIVDPLSSIEKNGRDVLLAASEAFKKYNEGIRKEWEGDEEEIKKRLLHLGDFQMRIDENGIAQVEGKFAENRRSDTAGHDIIEGLLKSAFEGSNYLQALGIDSSLKTSMGRFLELHEDNFGDTDEFHHQPGFDVKNGFSISAYAYSPEAEAASTAEIGTAVTKYLDANAVPNADQLEIEINDEDKIVVATPIADEAVAKKVSSLLEDLNNELGKTLGKDAEPGFESDGSALGNAVAEIAPHLKHVMSHRPGGGYLSVAIPDDDAAAEGAEVEGKKKELFDRNYQILRGTVPGTRSARKPSIIRSLERFA